ncbi:MAG: hypothetical protein HS115_01280 [Spirochaetales bacterium]|nr:hypothetical protein [Spirochaetales bacterium]
MPVVQKVPRRLEEVLGPEGTDQFVDFLNNALESHKEDVIQSVADKFEKKVVKETSDLKVQLAEQRSEFQAIADQFEKRVVKETSDLKVQLAEQRSEMKDAMANLRSEMDQKFGEVQRQFGEVQRQFGEVQKQFGDVQKQISGIHAAIAAQTRWLVVLGLAMVTLYPLIQKLLERLF